MSKIPGSHSYSVTTGFFAASLGKAFNYCLLGLALLVSAPAWAQSAGLQRILVLHGVWEAGPWDLDIDRGIAETLNLSEDGSLQVSFQYLGIDAATDFVRMSEIRTNIESMVRQQGITMIVAVQPLASDFLLNLNVPDTIPKLLLLPNQSAIAQARQRDNIAVVESASRTAVTETLRQLILLRPQTERIVVVGGSNGDDRVYVDLVEAAAQQYAGQYEFEYLIGLAPDALENRLAQLSSQDSILSLPLNSYIDNDGVLQPVGSIYLDRMIATVPAPLFGIYDRLLGSGLAGGNLSSTAGYARAVGRLLRTHIDTGAWPQFLTPGDASTFYDWREVQRWNLDLERLDVPVELVNAPRSLWDSNPIQVIIFINVIIALLVLVAVMALLLSRSRKARLAIAASEKLAREKEAQYRLLATNTADVIWTWEDDTQKVTYCSPSIEKLTGFTPDDFLNTPLQEMMTPESIQRCLELNQAGMDAQGRLIEVEHYTKSGGTVWCEMSAHPVHNDKEAHTWVGVTRDITQRKRGEQHRAQLEASVRQNQKFESLGTLAGGIAHDFNNVLGVMMGLIDLLRDEAGTRPQSRSLLEKLENSAQKAKRLVQRILTFARHREGDRKVIDLNELLTECVELLRSGVPPTITMETHITDTQVRVVADRTQIEQIVLNIATNAIEALPESSGTIRFSLQSLEVEEEADFPHGSVQPGHYARLTIEDDGIGISQDVAERIFDPFFTSKEMGSGMGLAIVRSVIIQQGGAIDLITQPGLGTRFEIYLPLTSEPLSEAEVHDLQQLSGEKLRILLIDDQEEVLETTRMMLEKLGHECVVTSDPIQGMATIDADHLNLDLVITDYSMPRLNGLQLVDICAHKYPALRVVISTGYGDALPRNTILANQRALQILKKPYNFRELRMLVEDVIREARAA